MKEQARLLAEKAPPSEALTLAIDFLQIRSDSPPNNGNEGLDANGISGIVIGILGLFVAIAGLVKGLKIWQRRVGTKTHGRDVEMEAPHLDNHHHLADASTIVNVWNIHIPPRVATPTPAVLPPPRGTIEIGDTGLGFQAQNSSPEPGEITLHGRVLTWPSHRGSR